jgi:hypothetical protein
MSAHFFRCIEALAVYLAEVEAATMSKNGSHDARGAVKSEREFYRRYLERQRQKATKEKQDRHEQQPQSTAIRVAGRT